MNTNQPSPRQQGDLHAQDELAICHEAIENCLDIVHRLDCMTDGDSACQRVTLRQLNEAIGRAAPRLLHERPEGQKLFGLRWRELIAENEMLRAAIGAKEAFEKHWQSQPEPSFNQAKATILSLNEDDAKGLAISLYIQMSLIEKYKLRNPNLTANGQTG